MPNDPKQAASGPQQGRPAQEQQAPALPAEVEAKIPQGQARLSAATGQSLSQMEPVRLGFHLTDLLAELAAGLQLVLQILKQQQQPPQPPQPA